MHVHEECKFDHAVGVTVMIGVPTKTGRAGHVNMTGPVIPRSGRHLERTSATRHVQRGVLYKVGRRRGGGETANW